MDKSLHSVRYKGGHHGQGGQGGQQSQCPCWPTEDGRRELYAHPPCENEPCFSRSRSKIPSRFPAAQNRSAHRAASRFFRQSEGRHNTLYFAVGKVCGRGHPCTPNAATPRLKLSLVRQFKKNDERLDEERTRAGKQKSHDRFFGVAFMC